MGKKIKNLDFKRAKTQAGFTQEAEKLFEHVEINWEKYEKENPDLDFTEIKDKVYNTPGWESIGFQRVLGGYFYDYSLSIIEMMIGIILFPIMLAILLPWPEGEGYYNVAAGYFGTLFNIFDLGTRYGLERFIGEYRVKDPKKMVGYIGFYCWYQMLTGIIQITIVSLMALYVFPGTDLSYAIYLFLILSTTQYPGFLGYFKSVLRGLQQFKYDNIVDFLRSNVFDFLTRLFFILFFRWVGRNNPALGELMGYAIGAALGKYVDEFINTGLAMYFFGKVMKPYGIRPRDCFNYRNIDGDVIRTALWWGFQLSLPGLIAAPWSFINYLITITYLPQYTTWGVYAGLTGMVTRILTIGSKLSLTPAMSEAYMNGKEELGQYYLANSYKWYFFLLIGVLGILIIFLPPLLEVIFEIEAAEVYQAAIPFVVPTIVWAIFPPLAGFLDWIIIGTNHPTAKTLIDISGIATGFIWHYFTYAILQWQTQFGIPGIVMLYTFAGLANWLIYLFIKWIFVEFWVFHIKIPVWQSFIAPALATFCGIIPVGWIWMSFVYDPYLHPAMVDLIGEDIGGVVAAAITLLMAVTVFLSFVFLPLYGFFGGWDDFGLLLFRKAFHLTGPSKPFVKVMYRGTEAGAKASEKTLKLHNRFPIEARLPYIQSMELLVERYIKDARSGFGTEEFKKREAEKKEEEGMMAPRAVLIEFFKEFKQFFAKTTKMQMRGVVFILILYGMSLSPVTFFFLGAGWFDQARVIIVWGSYVLGAFIIGGTGLAYARHSAVKEEKKKKLAVETA
ncbi:MAG: hypothetical protein ACFFCS_01255 [Candidatus Hodarchaeota archaeon]